MDRRSVSTPIGLEQAISGRRTWRDFEDREVPFNSLMRLLWAAQGITDDSGRRTAPSAHALHPLRLLVVAGNIDGLEAGVHTVDKHAKRLTPVIRRDVRVELQKAAIEDQPWIGKAAGIITICADFITPSKNFADQPPFGARGLRYVYIEAGAAAQNVLLQAVAERLGCILVAGFQDEATAAILELKAPIAPVMHLCFGYPHSSDYDEV